MTSRTRILKASEWLAFPPIAAPRTIADPSRFEAVKRAFLQMNDDPEGRAVLQMLRLDGFASEDPNIFDTIAAKAALVAAAG